MDIQITTIMATTITHLRSLLLLSFEPTLSPTSRAKVQEVMQEEEEKTLLSLHLLLPSALITLHLPMDLTLISRTSTILLPTEILQRLKFIIS